MNFELEEFIFNSSISMGFKEGEFMEQFPSIGRIIHVMTNREVVPAIITHVFNKEVVNATVFNKSGHVTARGSLKLVEAFGQLSETEWMWPVQTPSLEELEVLQEDSVEAKKVMLEETVNAAENAEVEAQAAAEAETQTEDLLN